jgi:hypothetical protein
VAHPCTKSGQGSETRATALPNRLEPIQQSLMVIQSSVWLHRLPGCKFLSPLPAKHDVRAVFPNFTAAAAIMRTVWLTDAPPCAHCCGCRYAGFAGNSLDDRIVVNYVSVRGKDVSSWADTPCTYKDASLHFMCEYEVAACPPPPPPPTPCAQLHPLANTSTQLVDPAGRCACNIRAGSPNCHTAVVVLCPQTMFLMQANLHLRGWRHGHLRRGAAGLPGTNLHRRAGQGLPGLLQQVCINRLEGFAKMPPVQPVAPAQPALAQGGVLSTEHVPPGTCPCSYTEQALVENYFKDQIGNSLTSYWIGLRQPWAVSPGSGTWCVIR